MITVAIHYIFSGMMISSVTAWAGLAGRPGPFEKKMRNIFRPEVLEITNRYYENDGVMHELAFGIVICFGSEVK